MTDYFARPMDAGPADRIVGYTELGEPVYQTTLGARYWDQPRPGGRNALDAGALAALGVPMASALQPGGARPPQPAMQGNALGSLGNALGGLAGAVWGGLTAPGRAAAGEPVTLGDVWGTALDAGGAAAPFRAPAGSAGMGIRAYHESMAPDILEFRPSKFRGASFFSATPEGAKAGASAGRAEWPIDQVGKPTMYEVTIDDSRIAGLNLTPDEQDWFASLPSGFVGTGDQAQTFWDALRQRQNAPAGLADDDFYNVDRLPDGRWAYTKKNDPPSIDYDTARKTGRDVYRRNWPHYNNAATDEAKAAERTRAKGLGGYLVQDEGGLSIAVVDPALITILRKYGIGAMVPGAGYLLNDDEARKAEIALELG